MVKQYPHTIVLTIPSGTVKDGNGNYAVGTPTITSLSGRYEPSSGNGTVEAADGTRINYSGICYLPLPSGSLKPGTPVTVKNGSAVLLQGKILRFSMGQLNARIWL